MRSRSAGNPRSSSSDLTTSGTSTAYSSSDMSCDTVVYRGQSDGSGTDGEGVPVFLPALRCLMQQSGSSGGSAGSVEELGVGLGRPHHQMRRRNSGSRILTNGAISPRRTLSPTQQMSPNRSLNSLPVIHEVNMNSKKMPLNGLVPVPGRRQVVQQPQQLQQPQQQQQEQWVDGPGYNSSAAIYNNSPQHLAAMGTAKSTPTAMRRHQQQPPPQQQYQQPQQYQQGQEVR